MALNFLVALLTKLTEKRLVKCFCVYKYGGGGVHITYRKFAYWKLRQNYEKRKEKEYS